VASTFISLPVAQVSVGSVQITDGVDNLAINSDGSINVAITGGGLTASTYNEVTSVASGSLTTVATFTASSATRIRKVMASGTNIAYYEIVLNGSVIAKKYSYFTEYNVDFDFEDGIPMAITDTVLVRIEHNRIDTGDFNATIITQG
jgi:hypothetical protein